MFVKIITLTIGKVKLCRTIITTNASDGAEIGEGQPARLLFGGDGYARLFAGLRA